MFKTISLIGCGRIGTLVLADLIRQGVPNLIVFEKDADTAKALAMDARHSTDHSLIMAGVSPADLKNSDLVILSASAPYTDIARRAEVIAANLETVAAWAEAVARYAPQAFVIVITNPVDLMLWQFARCSGLPRNQMMGLSGELELARFRAIARDLTGEDTQNLDIPVIGTHWPNPVYLYEMGRWNGQPLPETMPPAQFETIARRAGEAGAEIMRLLKSGSTSFAPAAATLKMIRALNSPTPQRLLGSVVLEGEYGFTDIAGGMITQAATGRIQKIQTFSLTPQRQAQLEKSLNQTQELQNFYATSPETKLRKISAL